MNKKEILSNRGYKIINRILLIIAIASWIGLLWVTHKLKGEVKDIKNELIENRK